MWERNKISPQEVRKTPQMFGAKTKRSDGPLRSVYLEHVRDGDVPAKHQFLLVRPENRGRCFHFHCIQHRIYYRNLEKIYNNY